MKLRILLALFICIMWCTVPIFGMDVSQQEKTQKEDARDSITELAAGAAAIAPLLIVQPILAHASNATATLPVFTPLELAQAATATMYDTPALAARAAVRTVALAPTLAPGNRMFDYIAHRTNPCYLVSIIQFYCNRHISGEITSSLRQAHLIPAAPSTSNMAHAAGQFAIDAATSYAVNIVIGKALQKALQKAQPHIDALRDDLRENYEQKNLIIPFRNTTKELIPAQYATTDFSSQDMRSKNKIDAWSTQSRNLETEHPCARNKFSCTLFQNGSTLTVIEGLDLKGTPPLHIQKPDTCQILDTFVDLTLLWGLIKFRNTLNAKTTPFHVTQTTTYKTLDTCVNFRLPGGLNRFRTTINSLEKQVLANHKTLIGSTLEETFSGISPQKILCAIPEDAFINI